MKAAVVYFSLEGNTELVAGKIAGLLGADLIALKPSTPYPTGKASKYFFGGKSSVFKEKPPLEPYGSDPAGYDTVILGTPLWAWSIAPPLRTFLAEQDLSQKRVAAFISCMGGDTRKAFDCIKTETRHPQLLAELTLVQPLHDQNGIDGEIAAFCEKIKG